LFIVYCGWCNVGEKREWKKSVKELEKKRATKMEGNEVSLKADKQEEEYILSYVLPFHFLFPVKPT